MIGTEPIPGSLYSPCPACESYYCVALVALPETRTIKHSDYTHEIEVSRVSTLHECPCGATWEVVLFDLEEHGQDD